MYLFDGPKEPENIRLMRLTDTFTSASGGGAGAVIAILVIILAGLLGFAVWFLKFKNKSDRNITNDPDPTP